MRKFVLFALAAGVAGAADFSYTEKTEITGGSLKTIASMAARFSRQPSGATISEHFYKGNKMALKGREDVTIYDLDTETITQINHSKKEYSTITFAEMAEATRKLASQMSAARGQKERPEGEVNFKADVQTPPGSRIVAGVNTRHAVMTVTMGMKDTKSGASLATNLIMDMWMGEVPGYKIVQDFQKRMGQKLTVLSGPQMLALSQGGAGALGGMAEAGKKLSELPGIPMYTVTRMGGAGMSSPGSQPTAQTSSPPQPSVGEQAKEAAGREAVSQGLGRLGRFGGFGRRPPEARPEPQPQPQTTDTASVGGGAVLMETTTEILSYSSNPVEASVFFLNPTYKQIEHAMKKLLKR